jgi:hypothetical protein
MLATKVRHNPKKWAQESSFGTDCLKQPHANKLKMQDHGSCYRPTYDYSIAVARLFSVLVLELCNVALFVLSVCLLFQDISFITHRTFIQE